MLRQAVLQGTHSERASLLAQIASLSLLCHLSVASAASLGQQRQAATRVKECCWLCSRLPAKLHLIAVFTSSSLTYSLRCIIAEASDMRMMLSRCLTAMGMPWLIADSLRKSAYTCTQAQTPCDKAKALLPSVLAEQCHSHEQQEVHLGLARYARFKRQTATELHRQQTHGSVAGRFSGGVQL